MEYASYQHIRQRRRQSFKWILTTLLCISISYHWCAWIYQSSARSTYNSPDSVLWMKKNTDNREKAFLSCIVALSFFCVSTARDFPACYNFFLVCFTMDRQSATLIENRYSCSLEWSRASWITTGHAPRRPPTHTPLCPRQSRDIDTVDYICACVRSWGPSSMNGYRLHVHVQTTLHNIM